MPLIKCIDCGKDVSDRAKLCPHCGCPIECSLSGVTQPKATPNTNTYAVLNPDVLPQQPDQKQRGMAKILFSNKIMIGICVIIILAVVGIFAMIGGFSLGGGDSDYSDDYNDDSYTDYPASNYYDNDNGYTDTPSNNYSSQEATPSVSIALPSLPCDLLDYGVAGNVTAHLRVEDVSYESNVFSSSNASVNLKVKINVLDADMPNTVVEAGYKLKDSSGVIVASGTAVAIDVSAGDVAIGTALMIDLNPQEQYTLVLVNSTY